VMHVISRDAPSGCLLLRDPSTRRRKPPSWKTCMWIDRFLCAIVAIVMPVALYKSFSPPRSSFHRSTCSIALLFFSRNVRFIFVVVTFRSIYSYKNISDCNKIGIIHREDPLEVTHARSRTRCRFYSSGSHT